MTTPTPIKRFMAPGPWITRELRECVQAKDYDALASDLAAALSELASVKAELQNIAEADYRKWDPEMRDPQSFVDWAKSRARHTLSAHQKDAP